MKRGCRVFSFLGIIGVFVCVIALMVESSLQPPQPTPFPTAQITRLCITEDVARSNISLYMAQVINSDDVGVLEAITRRPAGNSLSKTYRENNQVFVIRFSALKRGTGEYKKGWLEVTLRDEDCSIQGHRLTW